ncbi:MAG: hypothetical protein FWG77_04940 [Treponema sp.]|nr:hypothetical protein [Treponema sp.]
MRRGLLEIVKAVGEVNITDHIKLFTNQYLYLGRVVDLDSNYRVRIKKNNTVEWPFIFVISSAITLDGKPHFFGALDEEMAILMIESLIGKGESQFPDNKQPFRLTKAYNFPPVFGKKQ